MNLDDLPGPVRELLGADTSPSARVRLDALGVIIAGKRDDAVAARKSSGIEDTWMECEEAYLGIDDENRSEFMGSRWAKPTTMNAPVTSPGDSQHRGNSSNRIRATAYVRMTSRYVDAGAAKIDEILLPIDDKAFSFTTSPVQDLIDAKEDNTPVVHPEHGPLMRDTKPDDATPMASAVAGAVPGGQPGVMGGAAAPEQVPLTAGDLAEEQIEIGEKRAKKAEKRIYDWMVESRYPSEMRKVIFDASRIGVGILKGPFPAIRFKKAFTNGALVIQEKVAPAYKWIDPWNFYPDGTCGENIHHGSHTLEVDYLSPKSVGDLKDNDAYIPGQIDKVLAEGPGTKKIQDSDRPEKMSNQKIEDGRFEVWYYYGVLDKDDIQACVEMGAKNVFADEKGKMPQNLSAIITLINDTVVRVTINPLQSGEYCYHVMPWRRRAGHWAGVGVAEQIRMPQRMVTAATRAMLVNAAKSAGSQIIMQRGQVVPADSQWALTPDKLWLWDPDATMDDIRKVFASFDVPNKQKEFMGIIEYAFKLAEETSSIPLISQGQSGKTTPDTFGGQQLQDNNANQLLRSIGYSFDDHITEPVVQQSYEWLLLDPEVPDDEKGDFDINAHGSAAMVEKFIQNQTIMNMASMAVNPVFGIDPKRYATEYLKSQRLDPRDFKYTDDEQKKLDSQQQPPPPQVLAAQINAKATVDAANVRDRKSVV